MRQRVRHSSYRGDAQPFAESFIAGKEKCPIALDRPTQAAAELIALEGRNGLIRKIEIILGIQRRVAEELEQRAMQTIRP